MTSKDILIIIFIIILAGIIRWTSIDKAGYWCDEIYTLVGSTGHIFDETVDGEMLDPYFAVSPTYYKKWIDPYRGDFKFNFTIC